jgi:hypothetical protein
MWRCAREGGPTFQNKTIVEDPAEVLKRLQQNDNH